jgi:hypothetical protein
MLNIFMSPVIIEEVPVITEEEIEQILANLDCDIKCTCPEGTYSGVCCDGTPVGLPGCP